MLRVFQITLVLMGGLLLLMTGFIGQARQNDNDPLRWLVICCETRPPYDQALDFVEPITGYTRQLTPFLYDLRLLGVQNGWFYYYGGPYLDGQQPVYRVRLTGQPQKIADHATIAYAQLSPDGRWLVFQQNDYLGNRQWISVPVNGGTVHNLTAGLRGLHAQLESVWAVPLFSPDGTELYFQAIDLNTNSLEVFQAGLDGASLENLTLAIENSLRLEGWSDPDGLLLWAETEQAIYTLNPNNHMLHQITKGIQLSSWGILPLRSNEILTLENDSTMQVRRVTDGRVQWEQADVYQWSISPTSEWLLFNTQQNDWIVWRVDGSSRYVLQIPLPRARIDMVTWFPAGDAVLLNIIPDGQMEPTQIYRLDMLTQKLTPVYSANGVITSLQWSPDGIQLVISEQTAKGWRLLLMQLDDPHFSPHYLDGISEGDFLAGWGPTIDRPLNGNRLRVVGVLIAGVGLLAPRIAPTIIRRRVGPI